MGQTWDIGDKSGWVPYVVTASLNTSTGLLTISSSYGYMADFSYTGNDNGTPPWYASRSSIITVIIEEGVTNIGNNAFKDCTKLTSVRIANSVTRIGVTSFMNCSSLTSLTIPACVTTIEGGAFYGCSKLTVNCRMTNYPNFEYFPPTKPNFYPINGTIYPFNGISKLRVVPWLINHYSSGTYTKEILSDGDLYIPAYEPKQEIGEQDLTCGGSKIYRVLLTNGVNYNFSSNAGIWGLNVSVYNSSGGVIASSGSFQSNITGYAYVRSASDFTGIWSCTLIYTGKLSTPTLNATSSSCSVSLSWNSIAGATSYKVYRSSSSNGSYDLVGTVTTLSTTDTPPSNGTYYYKVEAINSSTKSDLSSYKDVTYTCTSSSTTCKVPPLFDYDLPTPTTSWNRHSGSIQSNGCYVYRVSVTTGQKYTFATDGSNGSASSFDSRLLLYNDLGTQLEDRDFNYAGEIFEDYQFSSSGYVYVQIKGYQSAFGNYTLAYRLTPSGTTPTLNPDIYEPNNTQATSYDFGNAGTRFAPGRAKAITTTALSSSANINTAGSNIHTSGDLDFYKITLSAGYNYTVTPTLSDKDNSSYDADVKFSYMQSNTGIWSSIYDTQPAGNFSVANGGTLYFKVEPYSSSSETGSYLLNVDIIRNEINGTSAVETTETDKLTIFPNPAKDEIYIKTEQLIEKMEIADIAGRTIGANNYSPLQNGVVNISALPAGVYLVKIFIDGQSVTKKIIKE
ncbi:MAG: leucine-rich repeat protein [Prevotellaceae bacterium]|nr:leucine-rich repeat protein [Prevotellaceae bacterium]